MEHAARYPAKYEFAEAGMPVPAHDHEAGGCIGHIGQQDARDVDVGCNEVPELRLDTMTHKVICHGGMFIGLMARVAYRDEIHMLGA